jgi:hypothetical protein
LLERGPDRRCAGPAAIPRRADPERAGRVRAAARALGEPVWRGPAFDDALDAELERWRCPRPPLPVASRRFVSPPARPTAVDVDSQGADPREVNRAAIRIARQLRLRDLAGPILLDLPGCR